MANLNEEQAKILMEAADWSLIGLNPEYKSEETQVVEEGNEEVYEEVYEEVMEEHFCPLCECQLEEEIPDEIFEAHMDAVAHMLADIIEEEALEDDEYEDLSEDYEDNDYEDYAEGEQGSDFTE